MVTLESPCQAGTRQLHATAGFSTRSLGTARVPFRTVVDITSPECAELRVLPTVRACSVPGRVSVCEHESSSSNRCHSTCSDMYGRHILVAVLSP